MNPIQTAALCSRARENLRGKASIRIAAIHAGVSAGVALVITILQYVLAEGIGNTGGLSGMQTRSILETLQTVLSWINSLAMPFWSLGFLFVALRWARGETARPEDLLMGFRRFRNYLRLLFSRALLVFLVVMLCAYVSSALFMLTPWAQPMTEFAQSAGMDMAAAQKLMDQMSWADLEALLQSMIPMLVIWGCLCLVLLVPLLYRFRMAEFLVLDNSNVGGMAAMLLSGRLMRRRCLQILAIDLRFWWYYLLQVLCSLVYCADLWLPLLGITLPESPLLTFGVYVAYLLALFGVQTLFRPQVETTYAAAYDVLLHQEPEKKPEPVKPEKCPGMHNKKR